MKLTKENIAEIAVMVFDGKTSAEIAEHFNISIPTVNYHRMKFKKNGNKLQKAKTIKSSAQKTSVEPQITNDIHIDAYPVQKLKAKVNDITLIVNGISVTINQKAKHVHVHPTHIEVMF
jgi:orotate phosphoribosyltransferase-like protein